MKLLKRDAADVVSHEVAPLEVNTDAGRYARLGWIVVILGFCGFVLWASTAPLDKGVPLSGTVSKESNRQSVQYQAGGTVQEILVKNGDVVKQGQVLVRMNPIVARSAFEMSEAQYLTARATEARLMAEMANRSSIAFPDELKQRAGEPRVAEILRLQGQLLQSRQSALQSEVSSVDESIAGLKMQIQGLQESRDSKKEQMNFLKEQLEGMRDLAKDGFVARNRLLELERTYAQLGGQISEDIGNLGRAQRQVMELGLRRTQRSADYQKEVRTQLAETQKEAEALAARLAAQKFELQSVEVKAPADGIVVGSTIFTNGGVVPPGHKMMDIVPTGDPLVVEGQLPVNLVDKVHPGLPVELMFSAFNTNTTPHIQGEVVQVAADRSIDEHTGAPYYVVRVKVTPEGAKQVAAHKMNIIPGMPVDLFVKTGERTMMNYLLRPIFDRAPAAVTGD
ncbi:HlyD family type I secretion periplasmic adaptor subunit [Massilia sp. MS-15]|uniref:HlyD family type I secretion periplasmic adaptor subunit n=1 Tax=Massilia sp. MS-15 TaxID=2878200 RepID=UPI001CD26C1D|nr:HlyD family type I secretion periplasmic adaptor subunit [Massilia sp. MS-15]MCA1248326.1 HlyD family type I secretion periplasmic adaptor subunit [Massilia sp. MS-15]